MVTVIARTLVFAQVALGWGGAPAVAGPYDPPPAYYNTATGVGAALRGQLQDLIDNHTVRSYDDARSLLQVTDRDPASPGRMLTVYDRVSINVAAINPGGSIPGWDSGNTWNREHTWPQSRGVGSSGPDYSDLHQLRPSDPQVNSTRGNSGFGGQFGQPFGLVSGGLFYPGDADAGMIARQMFYMAVRYDGSDSSTVDLEVVTGNPSATSNQIGDLANLLDWHYRAAPDDFERRRNDVIFDSYQGNRNPFVDRPEFVWSVFVDQANDTQVALTGAAIDGVGGTSREVSLGRVYAGGAAPVSAAIGVTKGGVDGTYFQVSTTGLASSSAGEYSRPLSQGAGVTDTFTASINATSSTPGNYAGTVVLDNLDITTGGGAGRGANDADDTVNLTYSVLSHPVASLAADAIVSAMTIDFGQVPRGSGTLTQQRGLFNYNGLGAPLFASLLDVDGLAAVGDAGVLSLGLNPTAGIAQGGGLVFDALFDTSFVGGFASTYTIELSGENLPGEQQQTLSLTLTGEVIAAGLAGDYNLDGVVDAADYTVYRDTLGSTTELAADGDASGAIDAADYTVWAGHYGDGGSPGVAIPEPGAGWLVAVGLFAGGCRRGARGGYCS